MSHRTTLYSVILLALVSVILAVFPRFEGDASAAPLPQSGICPGTPVPPNAHFNPYHEWGKQTNECTNYAWSRRTDLPWFSGNAGWAGNWATSARECGFPVDQTVTPGDIAVFPYGHVAYVEGVHPNGSYTISEQNFGCDHCDYETYRTIIPSPNDDVQFIHKKTPEASRLKPDFSPQAESGTSANTKPGIVDQLIQDVQQFLGASPQPSPAPPILAGPGEQSLKPSTNRVFGVTITPSSSLGRPSLLSPANGASILQNSDVTLSWNAQPAATQYKVEVWGGPYSKMTSCDWQSDVSCTIHQMWPGTISWHVRARDAGEQESDWSDTWSFTIGQVATTTPTSAAAPNNRPPDQFHLISPSGDVQLSNGSLPNLQWQLTSDPDGDEVQYDVVIDNANSPNARQPRQPDHVEKGLFTAANWQPAGYGLEKGGRYTWYVLADDGHGNRTGSIEHWQFTIALPHVSSAQDPCPAGTGPGGVNYHRQRRWL